MSSVQNIQPAPPNPDANPPTTQMGSNNPKLQNVKYSTLLPDGKVSQYIAGQKVQFTIPPEISYFDGKQSYLMLTVRNTSNWTGLTAQDGASTATANCPMAFPPSMGAHALINRLQIQDLKGLSLEDLETYNVYTGLLNSYCNDSDIFGTLGKVEGVGGRTTAPHNLRCSDPAANYFNQAPLYDSATGLITGGNVGRVNTFCLPINSGLFSAFAGEHTAYPNLDIGGTKLTMYLETGNRCLQTLASTFPVDLSAIGTTNWRGYAPVQLTESHTIDPVQNTTTTSFVSSVPHDNYDSAVGQATIDTTKALPNQETYGGHEIGFRIGQMIRVFGGTLNAAGELAVITAVAINAGATNNQLQLTHSAISQGDGTTLKLETPATRSYEIEKIELRLLETTPDPPTMKLIRRAMNNGLNYTTYQLNKLSTSEGLVNQVLDIPTAITRGLSIFSVPMATTYLDTVDYNNSYVFPRMDDYWTGEANTVSYQWQVKNILIPNVEVLIDTAAINPNDNCIYYNQQIMALRPMKPCKALGDHSNIISTRQKKQLSNPIFFPLLLSPVGSSYNLMESDPQLRIQNSNTAAAGNILQKLHHIYINHTRRITANDSGVEVSL